MAQMTRSKRRQLLSDVRSCIRCHYYKGYIIGLQWNPGKSEWDKQFGNVTGYLTHPEGQTCTLPLRLVLTANYQQETDKLKVKCREYVEALIIVDEAQKAVDEAKRCAYNCYLRQFF